MLSMIEIGHLTNNDGTKRETHREEKAEMVTGTQMQKGEEDETLVQKAKKKKNRDINLLENES